ncbi:MAG: UvrD-helicase domain-containing protein [Rhodanobacteraceae bacterium]
MTEPAQSAPFKAASWMELPLGPGGRSLIEASAGTGKTWTISVLYLRLLLEPAEHSDQPLGPGDMVVATFTEAAAQELRARIRSRLVWAERLASQAAREEAFTPGTAAAADEVWLVSRWKDDRTQAQHDLQRVRLALAELDRAPITTLHGLCRRILGDYPFECGNAFGLGELVSSESVLGQLAEDLWRNLQQGDADPPDFKSVESMRNVRTRLEQCLRPGIGLWTPDEYEWRRLVPPSMAESLRAFSAREGIWSLTPTGKPSSTLKTALVALADWLEGHCDVVARNHLKNLRDRAAQLDPDRVGVLLADPVMSAMPMVLRCLEYRQHADEIGAWRDWTSQMRERRDAQLAASDCLTYDDLLTRVHAALENGSANLADRLFGAWKVALIDEFQDTDALQFAILDRIWRDAAGVPRGRLVMIGDPKQAIYRFRGGDIEAYLEAAQDIDSSLALDTNRRSSRAYVAALNEWFEKDGPTLSAEAGHAIRVSPVEASGRRDAESYEAPGGEAARPLVIHYNDDVPASTPVRQQLALTACANRIASMLGDSRYRIAGKRLEPGEIAVLLPTNRQVARLWQMLRERGVPCVGAGKSNVFDTDWARELHIVLYAVEHAADEGAVRAALATRLGGLDFAELAALRDSPDAWQPHIDRFVHLKQVWQREGVLAVVLDFARRSMGRVPELPERERAMTDLRHLGELLQEQSEHAPGSDQLLAWLAEQRAKRGGESVEAIEERQLRIESDARRVRLMTLHASKGLEFPIVFLPLMWCHQKLASDTTPIIHESLCNQRIIGFGAEAQAQYARDDQNERFRVLYVALTRAVHACHVYALSPDRPRNARANARRCEDPERSALDAMVERLLARMPDAASLEHVQWVAAPWDQSRTNYRKPDAIPERTFDALVEPPATPFERHWSFSSLTRSRSIRAQEVEEDPAEDETASVLDAEGSIEAIVVDAGSTENSVAQLLDPVLAELSMLRGREFGNALHEIFERRRIGVPLADQRRLIAGSLDGHAVDLGPLSIDRAVDRIATRLDGVLAAEIMPGLCLGSIASKCQRAEMEFHFVLDAVSIERLRAACATHGEATLVPKDIPAMTLRGFMTGKIDLVFEHHGRFHVLDYKSNHLGAHLDRYLPGTLEAEMDQHDYRLQALLYSIALDRYLRGRVPDYRRSVHLGEAIYLFVRAVGIAPDAGVWTHRFEDALLDAVDAALAARLDTGAAA